MPLFISPRGEKYEIDNPADPQVVAWIESQGLKPEPSAIKDVLKSGISGIAEGVFRAPLIGADLVKLAQMGANKLVPGAVSDETFERTGSQGWIDAFKDSPQDRFLKEKLGLSLAHEPETRAGRYTKGGTSAVSGAVATAGLGVVPGLAAKAPAAINAAKIALSPGMAGINAASGVAGELGYDISRGFDDTRQGNPLVALLAGLGTSAVGNITRNAVLPNAVNDIYGSTNTMSPKDWQSAEKSLGQYLGTGAKTVTLADLPELQGRLGGLTQDLTNTAGGDLLRQKLSLQARGNSDIPQLLGGAVDDLGVGNVDAREVAKVLASAGGAKIKDAVKVRSTAMKGNLDAAGMVDPLDLQRATNATIRKARIQGPNSSVGTQQALDKAEAALLGKDALKAPLISQTNPQTLNVRALSKNVKSLRDIPTTETGAPRTAIARADKQLAGDLAEEALAQTSPGFRKAMDQYRDTTENLIDPMKASLIGGVTDVKDAESIISRLRKVAPDRLQAEVNSLGLSDDEVLKLAAVVGSKLTVTPNLTKASDSVLADRRIFDQLVDYVNPDLAKQAGKKLEVADSLSRLSSEHAADMSGRLNRSKNIVSTIVNPFGTVSLRSGLRTSEKEAKMLSDLIGNPTPENLAKIKSMSKYDPRAKRALEWISSLVGASQSSGTKE